MSPKSRLAKGTRDRSQRFDLHGANDRCNDAGPGGGEFIWRSFTIKLLKCGATSVSKLRQILINVLGNTSKFTREGTVKLWLNAQQADEPGRAQLVSILRTVAWGCHNTTWPHIRAVRTAGKY